VNVGEFSSELVSAPMSGETRRMGDRQPCGKTHARPARNTGGQPALRFYGVARSLKNKILSIDNFRVKQLNRLVAPGNLWL
jgi:hypothetical protein